MSRLVVPKVECIESTEEFGRFQVEPLEKGFAVTLGNALRRVLLAYLQGAAVTWVKVDGIQHEFTTIPYMKEDAIEFLLNVQALRIKPLSEQPGKLTLEVAGGKQVTAADIKPSADFEIVNPELYLATLDSPEAKLYVEFDVELGEGYRSAEAGDNMPIGTIPVDAIFAPVRKVNFTIESIHIGRETSRERLYLEVWTDGTMAPIDAVSEGARILAEQLTPFTSCAQVSLAGEEGGLQTSIPREEYNMPVEQLNLSVRTMNCLRRGGITTVGELITKGEKELMVLRNFGKRSKQEIEERLAEIGLSLASEAMDGEAEEQFEEEL
ncbi:MAG: DNA-directed RNA polymerase subunit alpha [Chloroflexota bacterium]